MRILGVDTAVQCTGMGVIENEGQNANVVEYGCIRNASGKSLSEKLQYLHDEFLIWIERTRPDEIAVEGVFFCRNVKTALSLGHARGVVIAACGVCRAPVYEYSPRRVKQAVCGFGGADKQQVASMVASLLRLDRKPPADAADALALAVCHGHARHGIRPQENRL